MYDHYIVGIKQDRIEISGSANQTVRLNSEGYFHELFSLPSTKVQELVLIAAGIFAVDRVSKRKRGRLATAGIRELHVTFQLQYASFWSSPKVHGALLDIVCLLTDDDWKIDFEEVFNKNDLPRHQEYLDFPKQSFERIALYSGGLDSAAGLAHQLLIKGLDKYLIVTVGHYHGLNKRVERQLASLESILNINNQSDLRISHSTLKTNLQGGKSDRIRKQETSQRSRALLFCATAVSAADVFKVDTVDIFENGVGSINLPVMTGMLGHGRATRGAHPSFLRKMSALASMTLERNFNFSLPFENLTKGELLKTVSCIPGMSEWLQSSSSCIHTSIREANVTHCGECPACIERRQAFMIAGIPEKLETYQLDINNKSPVRSGKNEYFNLYRLDAIKWQENDEELHRRLEYHLAITGVHSAALQQIVDLHLRHSHEVIRAFGSPFVSY